jgi:hypothetical protein
MLRRRVFWLFLLLGLLNFLLYFALIYVLAEIGARAGGRGDRGPPFLREAIFTGNGKSYRDFIAFQGGMVMVFLGFAGAQLIGNDFRFRAVAFYLSKPISKLHYFLGKLGAAAALTSLFTLVPALLLFLEYGAFTDSFDYFRDSQRIFWAILGYGALVCLAPAVLVLGIAALFQRTIPIVAAWGGIFAFLPLVGETFRTLSRQRGGDAWAWDLLNLWDVLRWISSSFFGIYREAGDAQKYLERLPYALLVLGAWMALGLWLFWRRVRAVEIVR